MFAKVFSRFGWDCGGLSPPDYIFHYAVCQVSCTNVVRYMYYTKGIILLRKEPINEETIRARDNKTSLYYTRPRPAVSKPFHFTLRVLSSFSYRENIFNPLMGIYNPVGNNRYAKKLILNPAIQRTSIP